VKGEIVRKITCLIAALQSFFVCNGGEDMEYKSEDEVTAGCALPYCAQTTDIAPLFTAEAYDNKEKKIKEVSLENYRGKWVILFFYGSDFTFV
jgi:AhpC/TSA family